MDFFRTRTEDEDTVSSSCHSQNTSRSIQTPSTAATQHSERFYESRQYSADVPAIQRSTTRYHGNHENDGSRVFEASSDASSETSADEQVDFDPQIGTGHLHHVPPITPVILVPNAIASNSQTFARHFPSDDRILIQHDNTTRDGNMNLRCDTMVSAKNGGRRAMTLFHLRMHDLKDREFSLRRYCRDSGREVCRTERVYQDSPDNRQSPNLYRSLSYALASLKRRNSNEVKMPFSPRRQISDDRCALTGDEGEDDDEDNEHKLRQRRKARCVSTNTINLEFSNYTHIDLSRKGRGTKKCYTFEYWGVQYSWRRQIKKDDGSNVVSFHLFKDNKKWPSAHIVPDIMSQFELLQEQAQGGWVPQCSLWIKDLELIKFHPDVAEVVVATGLIAMVDDTIKRTWPRKDRNKKRFSFVPSLSIGSPSPAPTSAPTSSSSNHASRPTSSRRMSSAANYKAKNLMNAVFRPQMLTKRQNTLPEDVLPFRQHQYGQPYGPYRRRTTA